MMKLGVDLDNDHARPGAKVHERWPDAIYPSTPTPIAVLRS